MRISSITKNAGKACNNRLYRHIRTFEKIIKNYFVIYRKFAYFLDDIIDGNRFINDELPKKDSGLSPVSISVGVAFTDRKKSSRFIFKDADKALYLVKENSRRGCAIY